MLKVKRRLFEMDLKVIMKFIAKEPVMALVSGGVILIFISVIVQPLRIAILLGIGLIIGGAAWKKYIG
jgi:hypothetical protein